MKMPAWFHPLAAALLVTTAFASPVRTQTLAAADTVPEGLSAPEWSSIRQQYEQQRHAAYPVAGGYQARNPGQQWQTRFDGRGFTVQLGPDRDRSPVVKVSRKAAMRVDIWVNWVRETLMALKIRLET